MASKRYAAADRKRCVSCGACARVCPRDAIAVWRGCFAVMDREKCVGCGKCRNVCPADCIDLIPREAAS